jgi:hypothetical protein
MVLLIEQERQIAAETNIYSIAPSNFPTTFGTILSTGVTAETGKIIAYTMTVKNTDTVARTFQLRVKFDGHIFFASGAAISLAAGASVTYAGILYLPAANYTLLFEGVASVASVVQLFDFQFGSCKFNDQATVGAMPYSDTLAHSIPAARKTPVGDVAYTTLIIQVAASTAGAVTNMEHGGETLTNGVGVLIGGSRLNWNTRFQDSDVSHLNGACGITMIQLPLTTSNWNIDITQRNVNTAVNISVIACPWILLDRTSFPSTVFPVDTLDFPQGSVFYCNLEPLFLDSTKELLIGRKRAVSFGDASDYYYYPSGTGLLECNFMFELPEVSSVGVSVFGWGGCINQIGVDTR